MKFEEGLFFQIVTTLREETPSRFLTPPANVYETEKEWIVELIMPGIDRNSLKVILEENIIKIEAKREEREEKVLCHHCYEWPYNEYRRIIELTKEADLSQISTIYRNGILKLRIPKKTKKIIEIEVKEEK